MIDEVAQEIDAILKLHNVKCPVKGCMDGYIYRAWTETTSVCCEQPHDNGECCGNAIGSSELKTFFYHCEWCHSVEELKEQDKIDNDKLQELIKESKK